MKPEDKKEFLEKFGTPVAGYSESDQMVAVMWNNRIKEKVLDPAVVWIETLVAKRVEEAARIAFKAGYQWQYSNLGAATVVRQKQFEDAMQQEIDKIIEQLKSSI